MSKPKCKLCNKEISYLNPFENNLDSAGYAYLDKYGCLKLTGDYGSTTLDMCFAIVNDYDILQKLKEGLVPISVNKNSINIICDECISKLEKEDKITILDSEKSIHPCDFIESEEKSEFDLKLITNLKIESRDIFLPYPRPVIAMYGKDGLDRIVDLINNHNLAKFHYSAKLVDKNVHVFRKLEDENIPSETIGVVSEEDVFILYPNGEDFDIMNEKKFKRRFQNISN